MITEIIILWSNIKEHLINQWIFLEFYSGFSSVDTILSFEEFRVYDLMRWIATVTRRISADNSHYEKLDGIERCIDDEIPFEIPDSWEWCKLGSITTVQSSKRVFEKDYVDEGIPFFRSKEIGDLYRGEEIHTQLFIAREHYEQLKRDYGVPQSGDILITSVGTIGNSWICDGREFYYKDGNITQIRAYNQLSSQYIQLFINSPLFTEQAQSTISGTAYNALTIIKLKNMLIPLPPLSEQHRIVEKQQELFDKITLI